MPRRARRDKRRRVALTPARALALTIGPDPLQAESDEVLVKVWEEHRDRLVDDHRAGHRPWAWWYFEPEVPQRLRGGRPKLVPVDEVAPARDEREVLEARRVAWIAKRDSPG
jgi:hypothetical protein